MVHRRWASLSESMTYQNFHLRNETLLNLLIKYEITLIAHRATDCVIYDDGLCVHSWTENWVGQLRGKVHPEIGVVICFLVSQHNE